MKKQCILFTAVMYCTNILFQTDAIAQCPSVTHVAGSDQVASAIGSGASGVPSLNYTAGAGVSRVVVVVLSFERDHTYAGMSCAANAQGGNWANAGLKAYDDSTTIKISWGGNIYNNPSDVSAETVVLNGNNLYATELSNEQYVFVIPESQIPASGGNISIVASGFSIPKNTGDEAVISASTYANVGNWYMKRGRTYTTNTDTTDTFMQSVWYGYPSATSLQMSNQPMTPTVGQPSGTTVTDNLLVVPVLWGTESGTMGTTGTTIPTVINQKVVSNTAGTFATAKCAASSPLPENDGIQTETLLINSASNTVTVNGILTPSLPANSPSEAVMQGVLLVPPVCSVLPITLTNFYVQKSGSGVLLNWSTNMEQNNNYFSIERSTNGVDWIAIGKAETKAINGNSNNVLNYTFSDASPNNGENYYRLIQTDLNQKQTVSNVAEINITSVNNSLYIYPNPAENILNINNLVIGANVSIYNTNGKIVKNFVATSTLQQININDLTSGVYFIKLTVTKATASKTTGTFVIK